MKKVTENVAPSENFSSNFDIYLEAVASMDEYQDLYEEVESTYGRSLAVVSYIAHKLASRSGVNKLALCEDLFDVRFQKNSTQEDEEAWTQWPKLIITLQDEEYNDFEQNVIDLQLKIGVRKMKIGNDIKNGIKLLMQVRN